MHIFLLAALAALAVTSADIDRARALMSTGKDIEAFALAEKTALTGNAEAIDLLGLFYDEGRGTQQDRAKAALLYRQAADRGVAHAQWRLGVLLDEGSGTETNAKEAVRLFRLAAAQGYSNAYVSLGVMQSAGRGTPRDAAGALASYKQAARMKNIHAFNEIGVVYANGEGVPADPVEAMAWFIVASVHGDAQARRFLGMLVGQKGEADLPRAEARANAIAEEYGLKEGATVT